MSAMSETGASRHPWLKKLDRMADAIIDHTTTLARELEKLAQSIVHRIHPKGS